MFLCGISTSSIVIWKVTGPLDVQKDCLQHLMTNGGFEEKITLTDYRH
jgi:hypothetical protein